MGTKVAPAYANTFMGWFKDQHVYTYSKQLLLWKQFIDDIFAIWQYGRDELDIFIQHLNSRMDSMKFVADISEGNVHFLDVDVFLDTDSNQIKTTLYTKPTDSHNYINYQSCHQKSCKNGIPYGQSSFERAFLQERKELLLPKVQEKDPDQDNLYLITTHHPGCPIAMKELANNTQIVIKPADKGGAVVVLDRQSTYRRD